MQTLLFLIISFLIVIFSTLLYFKTKTGRVDKLNSGECPSCGEKSRSFMDKSTNTTFKVESITTRLLKNHGCSGVMDIEYRCKSCGLKEVHSQSA